MVFLFNILDHQSQEHHDHPVITGIFYRLKL